LYEEPEGGNGGGDGGKGGNGNDAGDDGGDDGGDGGEGGNGNDAGDDGGEGPDAGTGDAVSGKGPAETFLVLIAAALLVIALTLLVAIKRDERL